MHQVSIDYPLKYPLTVHWVCIKYPMTYPYSIHELFLFHDTGVVLQISSAPAPPGDGAACDELWVTGWQWLSHTAGMDTSLGRHRRGSGGLGRTLQGVGPLVGIAQLAQKILGFIWIYGRYNELVG